jgi:intergrase/recombinase
VLLKSIAPQVGHQKQRFIRREPTICGPVAKYGSRRRPPEPTNAGSNPAGPVYNHSFRNGVNISINTAPLDYAGIRDSFANWLKANYSERYTLDCLGYLDRYLIEPVSSPRELVAIENAIGHGKRHFCLAIRALLNHLEATSIIDEDSLFRYRMAIRVPKTGSDDFVPDVDEVVLTYQKITNESYRLLYKLIFYSGIRLIEAVHILTTYNQGNLMVNGGTARYPLSMTRGTKRAIYAYIPLGFSKELRIAQDCAKADTHFRSCRGRLPLKYLRKWHYNFLITQGVSESVVDFIQGRALSSVGSMHYLAKAKQADDWYSRILGDFPSLL